MDILRTPDSRFEGLPGYSFTPHYLEVQGLRVHYLDEGPASASPILLLHGEPSWSYLYRKMIGPLTAAGHRVIAPDLVGFGRSDKPTRRGDYTYARHVGWMAGVITQLDLRGITLVCQDWGGLIGLRLAAEMGDRFDRIVAANTGLPTGDEKVPLAFHLWRLFSQAVPRLPVSRIIRLGCADPLPPEVARAYDAPFPDDRYKAGARRFPMLVPTSSNDPASEDNRAAWRALEQWTKPFLTAFSNRDPVTRGADRRFQRKIPGARDQPHTVIRGGGHFLQEDRGDELAKVVLDVIARTPGSASR